MKSKRFFITLNALVVVIVAGAIFSVYYNKNTDAQASSTETNLELSIDDTFAKTPAGPLDETTWVWEYTEKGNGKKVESKNNEEFVITFDRGVLDGKTDCNMFGSSYVLDSEVLSFSPFMSTKKFCEDSLETEFLGELALTTSHTVKGDELRLILNRDAGIMVFSKQAK